MAEFVPLRDVGYDFADAFARVKGSVAEEDDLRKAGTNYQGFMRVKSGFIENSAELEKQLKFKIVPSKLAKDGVVQRVYEALKPYEKISPETKEKLRALRILCSEMGVGFLYPSLVLNNTQWELPDYLSTMQRRVVELNHDAIEKDDPRLVKETEKFAPMIKEVESAFWNYITVYKDLWIHEYRPRRRIVLGDKQVPVLDEWEAAYNAIKSPGATRASGMPELGRIKDYLGITGAQWYFDNRFGKGSRQNFESLFERSDKTLLLPKAAERVREIAGILDGLRLAGKHACSEQNNKPG